MTINLNKCIEAVLILAWLTFLNILFVAFTEDYRVFLVGEYVIFLFVLSEQQEYVLRFSKEDEAARLDLENRFPLTRLEGPLAWCLIPALYLQVTRPFLFLEKGSPFVFLSFAVVLAYSLIVFYSLYAIAVTPALREHYNLWAAYRKTGWRSFSTGVRAMAFCKICFKVGAISGMMVYVGPKMVYGLDYRCSFLSWLTCPFNGFKTNSEVQLVLGRHLVEMYPQDKPLITDHDGVTIVPEKLYAQCKARALFHWSMVFSGLDSC